MSEDRILRLPEVRAHTGLGRSRIYSLINEKRFPAPVALGARARGWRLSEIQKWMESLQRAKKWTAPGVKRKVA